MLWKPTERQLWKRIKPLFEQGGGRAYRIETTTIPGFPDVIWFPVNRPAVLIELKCGPRIFGRHQISLMWRLHKIGHTVWVVWQEKVRTDVIVYDGLVFAGPDPDVAVKPRIMEFNEWLTWIRSA